MYGIFLNFSVVIFTLNIHPFYTFPPPVQIFANSDVSIKSKYSEVVHILSFSFSLLTYIFNPSRPNPGRREKNN